MRSIVDMDNIQVEVTNACHLDCSNCTRFCGHHKKPYMMDMDFFKKCIESVIQYPKIVGIMGGEPLLHPQFEEICQYALEKIGRDRLGLWTSLPRGKEHLGPTIVRTFKHVFLNDHTRPDIYHAPLLVPIRDLIQKEYQWQMWQAVDHCWVQNSWSASLNPKGAYFCEIAAAMAMLYDDGETAWPIDSDWWKKTPKDFTAQIEKWCPLCGAAVQLKRRLSTDGKDDIAPSVYEKLKGRSRKIKAGKCVVGIPQIMKEPERMAAYKDMGYRQAIAARYGMYLTINDHKYWEPHLGEARKTIFDQTCEDFGDKE